MGMIGNHFPPLGDHIGKGWIIIVAKLLPNFK